MSTGRFSDYQVEQWLSESDSYWVALHYDNPDISGAYASEVFGGSYTRVLVPFTGVDGRTTWNVDPIKWTGVPSVQVTHLAGWDAQINGNLLWSSSLDGKVTIPEGQSWSLGARVIALSIN